MVKEQANCVSGPRSLVVVLWLFYGCFTDVGNRSTTKKDKYGIEHLIIRFNV